MPSVPKFVGYRGAFAGFSSPMIAKNDGGIHLTPLTGGSDVMIVMIDRLTTSR